MALSLGFSTPHDLLAKVERDLKDLDSAIAAQDEGFIADALYNFSVSITSMKDWLKSHSSSSYTPNDVEALVAGSVPSARFGTSRMQTSTDLLRAIHRRLTTH
jgi:hypothetical protein